MRTKKSFFVAKINENTDIYAGYSWSTGTMEKIENNFISSTFEIDVRSHSRFISNNSYKYATETTIYFLNANKKVITSKTISGCAINERIPKNIAYIAVEIMFSVSYTGFDNFSYNKLKEVNPHYKNLKKHYKKESNQQFFRESLDGKITLWGSDYTYINQMSIEDKLAFYIYSDDLQYMQMEFTKTDCKFDHFRSYVELKLNPIDKYTNIINAYEKKYDLLKLPTPKSFVTLTKRAITQIYVQGESVITNYGGGTYWEDEVTEAVDDQDALLNKYHFAKGSQFFEISLSGFNYDINAVYVCVAGQRIWNGVSTRIDANGKKYKFPCSIVFTKIGSAGEEIYYSLVDVPRNVVRMSDGKSQGYNSSGSQEDGYTYYYLYDTYKIEIYTGNNGTGTKIYESEYLFGNDSNFIIKQGSSLYKMVKISQQAPSKEPEPSSFFLGEQIITYQLWGRLLCDAEDENLYDLPYDDFATQRANFRKCIGLQFSDNDNNKLVYFQQSTETQSEPTPYGVNEFSEYFIAPVINGYWSQRLFPYPLARNTWGNSSLWIGFDEDSQLASLYGFENYVKQFYKPIQHHDMMEVGGIIKVLLKQIDPSVTFESTPEYSTFLYGNPNDKGFSYGANNLSIYITQKSNILKGEYDQAAQKAEITFKQLMEMMRDCFKCYWFIDSENRFRIEHIRFFINGLSYDAATVQLLDLTTKLDKFNKKPTLYAQQEISYAKSDLNSRYEFAWADDVTTAMGGGFIVDVKSNLIEASKIENINISSFCSDVDFMMFAPDKFSQDGFALLVTKDNAVPIIYDELYDQRNTLAPVRLFVQNYYASFISLFSNYLYDMPALNISTSIDRGQSRYQVKNVKRCMEHIIEFQSNIEHDIHKLIKTEIGNGYVEDISIDVDTDLAKATLTYEPK